MNVNGVLGSLSRENLGIVTPHVEDVVRVTKEGAENLTNYSRKVFAL